MSRRPPAPPPDLPGYTVTKLLGSGGFADVYRYEQHLPRRSVAVKVLIPGAADTELLAQFDAEANLMAALSTHPAIVTIHQAGISGDGRPYMVMEYCSRPNLSQRYRAERLSVAEVLRIGIRLAGAVETAHRAGILHRDIKPANVLTTDFGHPVLSDFGISVQSSTQPVRASGGSVGMSIPWSAPEIFDEHLAGDERADVYSLAATLYTLLARRSPFDRPGGPNTSSDLINRIRGAALPALGRSDVPQSLERVIGRAMDRNRAARYATALDLGRALQQVEGELHLAPTPVDVLDEDPDGAAEQLGDSPATRIRALTVIEAQPDAPDPAITAERAVPTPQIPGGVAAPPAAVMPEYAPPSPADPRHDGRSQHHHGHPHQPPPGYRPPLGPTGPAPRRSRTPLLVGVGLLVLTIGVIATVIATRGTEQADTPPDRGGEMSVSDKPAIPDPPSRVVDVTGRMVDGKAVFSWRNPDDQPGDSYMWRRADRPDETKLSKTPRTVVTITDNPEDACIAVMVLRSGMYSPENQPMCVEQK